MSLTDRDRKLVMILVPVVLLVGYWFLVLSPQRAEVSRLDSQLTTLESDRDDAVANAQQLEGNRSSYAKDYATVVRLGKAIPSTLDMPSLLVQMEAAAKGSDIDFDNITVGPRTSAATATASSGTSTSGGSQPVDAGGEKAQTGAGKATEKANDASATSDKANQASGADASSTAGSAAATPVAGLDTVPLTFDFKGSYFDLADFFHRVKRFVRVANEDIKVKGRLMTIDTMSFKSELFPSVTATVAATVYLAPKTEGSTGGATSQGPATATPAASTTPSTSATPASSSSPAGEGAQ